MAALAVLGALGALAWLCDENRPRWLQVAAGAVLIGCCVFIPTLLGAPA